MEFDSSETNLVIITRRERYKLFWTLYWKSIVQFSAAIILLPIIFIKNSNAYLCFYIFILMIIYWIADVLHPAFVAIIPLALSSIMGVVGRSFVREILVGNDALDCIGVLMLKVAIEHSNLHRRIALKVLLIVGCSHYRLSLFLFFTTMFLGMWISDTVACGLMMPFLKAILTELEKMGIIDIYQTEGEFPQKSTLSQNVPIPRPSQLTIFYYLGIAYSSSIGNMGTLNGSHSNRIFKMNCETIFPAGPQLDYPQFLLLTLPGVLMLETLLYLWMNFYFLGLFRHNSTIQMQIGMTEEETTFIHTLLATKFKQMGKITFHESAVATIAMLSIILQITLSTTRIDVLENRKLHYQIYVSSPCLMCVILLYITPVNLEFIKFFQKDSNKPLPSSPTKKCLDFEIMTSDYRWSVPLVLGIICSNTLFESLRDSDMTDEFQAFMLLFENWSKSAFIFMVVVCSKILTEFATSSTVVYGLLPTIAHMSLIVKINPQHLMLALTLGSSLSFHLMTGSGVNAMVCSYINIPAWKMMKAGLGPSLLTVVVIWFTVAVWSSAIWTDINNFPTWSKRNAFKIFDNPRGNPYEEVPGTPDMPGL